MGLKALYTLRSVPFICDYWRHRQCVYDYEHFFVNSHASRICANMGESIYSVQQINELLERGIARLSENQRKIYRMNVCDGMQISEIAIKLDVKYKNVENRLCAARKEVRKYMKCMLA